MRRSIQTLLFTSLISLALSTSALAARPHARPYPGDAGLTAPTAAQKTGGIGIQVGPYTNPMDAASAIGNRLVDIQSDVTEDNAGNGLIDTDTEDGGWDWGVTGFTQHSAGKSYENLYGPIARGLGEAAIFTGSARLGTGIGDVFSGISMPGTGALSTYYYRIFDADIATAYVRRANQTGNAALKDTIKARHDTELVVRGGAGGRARTIRNGRGAGLAGLWPWDVHLLSNDSKALAGAFPGSAATYEAEVDSISQVIMDDKNLLLGPTGWDPSNFMQNYHQVGVAGALRVFDASLRVDDNALATAMRDSLVNGQLPDGSWGLSYGGVFYADDGQATAYAVLALMEYSERHNDATARHAAILGQQWLLSLVSTGGVVDDGGGEYSELDGEVLQALLVGDDVTPGPAPSCITSGNPCIGVPVTTNRIDATPMRAYSVTLTLSGNLSLCGANVVEGGYLSNVSGTTFQVVNNGGGSYTVDCAILGLPCGATGNGTLFTLNLAGTGTGTGTVTINSVTARDCANAPVGVVPGAALNITIDHTPPANITALAAAQQKTGNSPSDSTTAINLSWPAVEAGASVKLWRKGYGNYPEYDDAPGAGSVPSPPGSYPPPGWTLAATVTGPISYADHPTTRDFWYYVAYVVDACGNVSAVSNRTGGTLDYHLGDVANGSPGGTGNNSVGTEDISLLGSNYGITLIANDPVHTLDVGPTTDYSVDARPTTDNKVNFEDLMMFAINYGVVSAPQFAARRDRVPATTHAVRLALPALPAVGETFAVGVMLESAGAIQGLSLDLSYDAAVVEPVGVEAAGLLLSQEAPGLALSAGRGDLDVALLGTNRTIVGAGEVARMVFRVKGPGPAAIALGRIEARDAANRPVALGTPVTVPGAERPASTVLMAARPNPFAGVTTLSFALAQQGPVELTIYSVDGRKVTTVVRETKAAGTYHPVWDGRDARGVAVQPGMYYARLVTQAGRFTRTLVLMK